VMGGGMGGKGFGGRVGDAGACLAPRLAAWGIVVQPVTPVTRWVSSHGRFLSVSSSTPRNRQLYSAPHAPPRLLRERR